MPSHSFASARQVVRRIGATNLPMRVWRMPVFIGLSLVLCAACKPAEPAPSAQRATTPPPVAMGPQVQATISPRHDAIQFDIGGQPRSFTMEKLFDDRATAIEQVKVLGQKITPARADLMLQVDAASVESKSGPFCANASESVVFTLSEDIESGSQITQINVLESCRQRIRIVSQDIGTDGLLEIEQEQADADGSTSKLHLSLDTRDPGRGAEL